MSDEITATPINFCRCFTAPFMTFLSSSTISFRVIFFGLRHSLGRKYNYTFILYDTFLKYLQVNSLTLFLSKSSHCFHFMYSAINLISYLKIFVAQIFLRIYYKSLKYFDIVLSHYWVWTRWSKKTNVCVVDIVRWNISNNISFFYDDIGLEYSCSNRRKEMQKDLLLEVKTKVIIELSRSFRERRNIFVSVMTGKMPLIA